MKTSSFYILYLVRSNCKWLVRRNGYRQIIIFNVEHPKLGLGA